MQTEDPPTVVIDVDDTLAIAGSADSYADLEPDHDVVERLRACRAAGLRIALHTSRNMRTHDNRLGAIVADTIPVLIEWLQRHEVPYDEIWPGKPWCGPGGYYVDDRAIRPDEFVAMSDEEIGDLLAK